MNLQDVQAIMAAFVASGAMELVLEVNGTRLELRKGASGGVGQAAGPMVPAPAAPVAATPASLAASAAVTVSAPVDGVFYRVPNPGAPAFAEAGDTVAAGQVLGLVEVMKMMTEVRSPAPGVVRAVLAENGTMVKAGRPLVELEVQSGAGS